MSLLKDYKTVEGMIFGKDDVAISYLEDGSINRWIVINDVDLWLAESHQVKIKTTRYPIEDGSSITDNAFIKPRKLTLTGYVSNIITVTPSIPFLFGSIGYNQRFRSQKNQKTSNAWAQLKQLASNFTPIKVVSNIEVYGADLKEHLIITSLTTDINSNTGTSMQFEMKLSEIKIATSESRYLPNKVSGNNNPASSHVDLINSGHKNTPTFSIKDNSALEYVKGYL